MNPNKMTTSELIDNSPIVQESFSEEEEVEVVQLAAGTKRQASVSSHGGTYVHYVYYIPRIQLCSVCVRCGCKMAFLVVAWSVVCTVDRYHSPVTVLYTADRLLTTVH